MLTEKQKTICEKYSTRDSEGKVGCFKCPLVISHRELMCRGNAHYDRHKREWIFD